MHFPGLVDIIILRFRFYFPCEDTMRNFKINKVKEQKLIWSKFRQYIDFVILACCFIIALNIHPSSIAKDTDISVEKMKMVYIFHDYEWNEYIMNDKVHWASSSWTYLFEDEVPIDLRWDEENKWDDPISIWDLLEEYNNNQSWLNNTQSWDSVKDNQVSIDDIMSDLWVTNSESTGSLVINVWDYGEFFKDNTYYTVKSWNWPNELIIEIVNSDSTTEKLWDVSIIDEWNDKDKIQEDNALLVGKTFTFVKEWWVLPALASRNDLYFENEDKTLAYNDNTTNNWNIKKNTEDKKWGITIIDDYAGCMTPWWYKIAHWDSVLAYKQMDEAPDICNIERRFCWKWKLSWTYTQQWCSINKNYTYEEWWNIKPIPSSNENDFKWGTRQNSDWTVTVKNSEIWWSFVFERINGTRSDFSTSYNIRPEDPEVQQQTRTYWGCTTPRWEKLKHWEFVQAFKHANWFSDAPCEAQIRLCTMWELMWTFTESRCQTRDTSFIDWVNGSPTRDTYSEEKLDLVRKQIKNEEKYYREARKNADRSTNSNVLDRILYILDQD